CRRGCWRRSNAAAAAGAALSDRGSTAGPCRSSSGGSIPTRRWSKPRKERPGKRHGHINRQKNCSARLASQPNYHVDTRNLVALGRNGRPADDHVGVGNVEQIVLALDEEMVVLGNVGIEIGL